MSLIRFDERLLELDNRGKELYQTHTFFHTFANLMEHPEFNELIREQCESTSSVKLFAMLVQVYCKVGDEYPELTGYQKIAAVKALIDNPTTRQVICKETTRELSTKLHELH